MCLKLFQATTVSEIISKETMFENLSVATVYEIWTHVANVFEMIPGSFCFKTNFKLLLCLK